MGDKIQSTELQKIANECRVDILNMLEAAASGHPGGSLSVIDILVTLFFSQMRIRKEEPLWEDRDRLVLSKGHGVPALYTVFSKLGWLPKEELTSLRRINSRLQGHPDRVMMPIVEASTGSLGQGLSIAQGLALGLRLRGSTAKVFCVMGDGEIQEGQVCETAMSAPKFDLSNLVAIVDQNNGQIDGHVEDVMDLRPLADKWRAFRWNVYEVDGHDFSALNQALDSCRAETNAPSMIIARTVKGKGVSFMENNIDWHGVAPNKEQAEAARKEILSKSAGQGKV